MLLKLSKNAKRVGFAAINASSACGSLSPGYDPDSWGKGTRLGAGTRSIAHGLPARRGMRGVLSAAAMLYLRLTASLAKRRKIRWINSTRLRYH